MKMKKILFGIIPTLFLVAGCEGFDMKNLFGKKQNQALDVNVIILSGQSNAIGCKNSLLIKQSMGEEKYNEYNEGYEEIKIAYNNYDCDYASPQRTKTLQSSSKGKFVKVKLGQGNVPDNFGPEVGMAEELHNKWANKLYIIKCACGASNLNDDWSLVEDTMFQNLTNFVNAQFSNLKKEGLNPILRAFCWMQGEGDSYDKYCDVYYENLQRLKTNLDRAFLKLTEDNNLPFVDAGIGMGKNPNTEELEWKHYAEVNEAKRDFAKLSETNIYFDTIEEGLHSNQEPNDFVHYDSESVIKLGHLFAKAYEPFLK